jgi:hypothetical protein
MRLIRFFLPRIEYILFAGIFWGIAASGPRILNFDGDLPRHILTGSLILQTHEVALTDIFSFRTAGYPSIPHEWLAQVIFAGAYIWLGLSGIVLLTALLSTFTWIVIFRETIRRSNSLFFSLFFIALGVAASQIHVLPRPHLFTYLLTATWITLLERVEREANARLLLPLTMLLWVNLHGMFVIGIIIWGIYLMGDFLDGPSIAWFTASKTKALIIGGALALLATLCSPSGAKIWEAIISLGGNTYITSKVPEYQSANFHIPETWPFIILLTLTVIGFGRVTQRVRWIDILLVVSFAALALYTSRMIPLFAILATPIAANALALWIFQEFPEGKFLRVEKNINKINSSSNGNIWVCAVIIVVAILFRSGKTIDPNGRGNIFDPRFFPVEAVTWLGARPQQGNMFNEFDWGGYLLLRLWPQYQIFMDGHTHIYGEELTKEYERVITLDAGWEAILAKYDINLAIVRANSPLVNALSKSVGWSIEYQDPTAVILIRR